MNHFFKLLTIVSISSFDGNLPSFFFEKTSFPSYSTSKTPPLDSTSSVSAPNDFFRLSARPAAWGL
jgi:hypothetical protein